MEILAKRLVSDEGTVVVFEGVDNDDGRSVRFAVDHRYAEPLHSAIVEGLDPVAVVPGWAVIDRSRVSKGGS